MTQQPPLEKQEVGKVPRPTPPLADPRSAITKREDQRLARLPFKADLATGEELDKAFKLAIVKWAEERGLNPWSGHVAVMYGRPYITVDGRVYHAMKTGHAAGYIMYPTYTEEKLKAGFKEGDHVWRVTVRARDPEQEVTEYGIVREEEIAARRKDGQPWDKQVALVRDPDLIASKRGLSRALARLFPLDAESMEEVSGADQ